jgi:hypothetical protein
MEKKLDKIDDPNYLNILNEYLGNQTINEILYSSFLEMSKNKDITISQFKKLLIDFYQTDDQQFFEIFSRNIESNDLDGFDFHHLTSYNLDFKEWKIENDIDSDDDEISIIFYETNPYAYLHDVSVYALRSANKLCLVHHCHDEFISLEYYPIQSYDILSQLGDLSQKISAEYN